MTELSSKVRIIEEDPKIRGIPSVPTSTAGAVGIAERGKIGEAVLCTSFDEYRQKFGGFTPDSDLALAAAGFFENGGSQLYIVRTCHYTDVSDPETATAVQAFGFLTVSGMLTPAILLSSQTETFALNDGDKIVLSIDGASDQEAIFEASPAEAQNSVVGGPFTLNDGDTLTLQFEDDVEQTVVFRTDDFIDIANATEVEVAAAINAQINGGKATTEVLDD